MPKFMFSECSHSFKSLFFSHKIEDSKIKHELMYYLSDEYGWFWHSETDVMKDYKYYFSQHNSANLSEKYPGKKILKKKSMSWKVISK